ncbi:hypothetical protein ACQ4PT_011948 [Festuca glaucescens]
MDDASAEPLVMPLDLLRRITNNFSEERKIGSGSYGKVYMGVHQGKENIAVKLLYDMPGVDEKQFHNEFKNLTRVRHQNVVRLVGYCHDIQEVQVKYEGKLVIAERTHRALCLEYMSNGSLAEYLSDECDRYDWHTGYRIIKGICKGLNYLHNEIKPPIYHLDLKPANILLDENMVPRIADFGMSRLFKDEQTRATNSSLGTIGYLPPEYICNNLVSNKFDIYSLGVVIIKIMAGRAGYFNCAEMSSEEFTNLVQENWTNRILETSNRKNAYSEQVKICIAIGLSCVQEDRHKRPTIQDIVDRLNETETKCTYAVRKDSLIYLEADVNIVPEHIEDQNDGHVERYFGSTFNQNIVATTHSNHSEENADPTEARLDGDSQNDNQKYSTDGISLPGIEGYQIVGDPRPGFTLRACGFPINGTTLCSFQWIRLFESGTWQSIEGATMYDFVVTADDVGALLAVDFTPMDDNGLQGHLVTEFANNGNCITCDPEMQNDIDICIWRGRADFDVYVLEYSADEWEQGNLKIKEWEAASLVLRRTGYQINNYKDECVIEEKYSPNLQIKIPNGLSTQFVLVSSGGIHIMFNTQGITESNNKATEAASFAISWKNNEANDVRLRDIIVLVMRSFQQMALDATVKTDINATEKSHTEYSLSTSLGEKLNISTPSPSTTNPTAELLTFLSNKN